MKEPWASEKKITKKFAQFKKTPYLCTTETSVRHFEQCPGGGMVDALVSGASAARRAGSSPVLGTMSAS